MAGPKYPRNVASKTVSRVSDVPSRPNILLWSFARSEFEELSAQDQIFAQALIERAECLPSKMSMSWYEFDSLKICFHLLILSDHFARFSNDSRTAGIAGIIHTCSAARTYAHVPGRKGRRMGTTEDS